MKRQKVIDAAWPSPRAQCAKEATKNGTESWGVSVADVTRDQWLAGTNKKPIVRAEYKYQMTDGR